MGNYLPDYLTFIAREAGTFTFTYPAALTAANHTSMSYSLDGRKWVTTYNVDSTEVYVTTPTIPVGGRVYWKGTGNMLGKSRDVSWSQFSSTGTFDAVGNIMSLLYGDSGFESRTYFNRTNGDVVFNRLFYQSKIVDAHELLLPATQLYSRDYASMFSGCTSLLTTPELPALNTPTGCYGNMFQGCTALKKGPSKILLSATGMQAMVNMFSGCTSLVMAPELPATTLTTGCYNSMFYNCKALTRAPVLPALTLASSCYNSIFRGCSNLVYIKMMATDISASGCLTNWVNGVNGAGTFVKNSAATWENTYGSSRIPTNFTVITESE